jgi:transaldolase
MKFPSKIYIDGGDPEETRQADAMLKKAGYHGLDGQTTNPTLIAKKALTANRKSLTEKEAINFYRKTVEQMSKIIPNGKISIQVIGDPATLTTTQMLSQARDRIRWIPNGVIKFPCTTTGLIAVEEFCEEGPVNITLNFSQEQAAAVYAATKTHNYDVYISPFVGRLDDRQENGMDVVSNELEMFKELEDNHVHVLTASVRSIKHLMYALWLKSPVITIPFKVFKEWSDGGFKLPSQDFIYDPQMGAGTPRLAEIPYKELTLDKDWKEYNLKHDLTTAGVSKFWEDWKSIVSS